MNNMAVPDDIFKTLIDKNVSQFTENEIMSIMTASKKMAEDKSYNPVPTLNPEIINKIKKFSGVTEDTDESYKLIADLIRNFIVQISDSVELKELYETTEKENKETIKEAIDETNNALESHRAMMIDRINKSIEKEENDEYKEVLRKTLDAYNNSYTLEPLFGIANSKEYIKGCSKEKYRKRFFSNFDFVIQCTLNTSVINIDTLYKEMINAKVIKFEKDDADKICMILATYSYECLNDKPKCWFLYNTMMNISRICSKTGYFNKDDKMFASNLDKLLNIK